MAKNWYPIIDEEKCIGCFQCVEFCPHGVLAEGDGRPEVVKPEECVEFCMACKKLCDQEAITYFGEN